MNKQWHMTKQNALASIRGGASARPFEILFACYSSKRGGWGVCTWAAGDENIKTFNGEVI